MNSLEISGEKFYKTLDEVHRHAGKVKSLPALCGVCFSVYEDRVVMEATDRFTYLAGQVKPGDEQDLRVSFAGKPELRFLVTLEQIKPILSTCRAWGINGRGAEVVMKINSSVVEVFKSDDDHPAFVLASSGLDFPNAQNLIPTGYKAGEYTAMTGERVQGRKNLRYCIRHGMDGETDLSTRSQLITQATNLNRVLTLTGCAMPVRVDINGHDYPELED